MPGMMGLKGEEGSLGPTGPHGSSGPMGPRVSVVRSTICVPWTISIVGPSFVLDLYSYLIFICIE